jgi:DinB superfamily
MTGFQPGIPQPGEYNPFFEGYLSKSRAFADPIRKLNEQHDEVLSVLRPLSAEIQLHRYAPGKWSVKETAGHLIDTERILTYRALRIARGDQTPLPGFDESAYATAAETERCDWNELLEEFSHVRKASILMLRHLPDEAWMRTGTSNSAPISVRALAYIMIGHVAHHLAILHERYL